MNPYIADILSQPNMLRMAVDHYLPQPLKAVSKRIKNGKIDRILITGMGASFNAAYPAYIQLSGFSIPVLHINAAELVHSLGGLVGPRTLLWINSQSGRSAEILRLLERIQSAPPACLLACANDLTSPLAAAAEVALPIHAGVETAVSTKTYVNTIAVNLLVARQLAGMEIESIQQEMLRAADTMESYLESWETRVDELEAALGQFEQLILLGRGGSMSAVWNGSLINKEAAKFPLEGMHAADFRHGPLELVSPGFSVLIFAGADETASLNHNLGLEVLQHGGNVFWISPKPSQELETILIPESPDLLRPLVEILPMQLLTLVMARRKNVQAGQFRYIEKITQVE